MRRGGEGCRRHSALECIASLRSAAWPLFSAMYLWAALNLAGCAGLPETTDEGNGALANTIKWSTASESDNFGFDIYRSQSADGGFERITTQPIVGGGTTDVPRQYRFVDESIEAGQTYFYYVESISLSGERKRFTPLMRAPAKFPTDD